MDFESNKPSFVTDRHRCRPACTSCATWRYELYACCLRMRFAAGRYQFRTCARRGSDVYFCLKACRIERRNCALSVKPGLTTMTVYLITGASRGLGLGLVQRVLEVQDTVVFAAARSPGKSQELQALCKDHPDRALTVTVDTADEQSIKVSTSWKHWSA